MKIRIKERRTKQRLGILLFIVAFLAVILVSMVMYHKQKEAEPTVHQMESAEEVKLKEMLEELMFISQSLDKMDGSVENNLDALGKITEYGTEMTEQVNILDNSLSHMEKQIQNCLSKYESSNQEITAELTGIVENIVSVRENVVTIGGTITDLLIVMQSADAKGQKAIEEKLEILQMGVAENKEQMLEAYKNLETILNAMQKYSDADHKETMKMLAEVKDGMGSLLLEEMYNTSIQLLQNEISQNFEDVGSSVLMRIGSLNETMNSQNQTLTTMVNTGNNNLQQYLENAFGTVSQKMDSVFQYVSDGKKILASALLTKGVSCKEDATFMEIRQAILSILQKMVIGVEQIPGKVTYDYHFHMDAGGENSHADKQEQYGGLLYYSGPSCACRRL